MTKSILKAIVCTKAKSHSGYCSDYDDDECDTSKSYNSHFLKNVPVNIQNGNQQDIENFLNTQLDLPKKYPTCGLGSGYCRCMTIEYLKSYKFVLAEQAEQIDDEESSSDSELSFSDVPSLIY